MTTSGRLYTALDKGSLLTEILSPVIDRVEESGLINPDFEAGDTRGWSVFPEWAADALATAQPPQLPGSTHYLGRADLVAARDADWRVSQKPPAEIYGKPVDVSVDIYRTAGATAELIITTPAITITPGASFDGNKVSNGGENSVGRLWVVPNALTYGSQTGQLTAEVIAAAGTGVNLNDSFEGSSALSVSMELPGGQVDILFTRAFSEVPFCFNVGDISTSFGQAEFVEILTPEVRGFTYASSTIAVSNGGKKFSGTIESVGSNETNSLVTIYVPAGVSTFSLRYFVTAGNIGFSSAIEKRAPGTPSIDTIIVAPDRDGAWATHTAVGVLWPPGSSGQSLITLRGVGDVWFDNLRVTQSVREATSYTALSPDLATRRHVALAEGSLTFIGQDGIQTVQEIPMDVLGDTLAVRSGLVLVALENKLHRSGDLGKTWLSVDLPDAARQIIIGPAPTNSGPIIPPGIGGLIDAIGGLTKITNGILDVTGNAPITVPDINPTPSSTETIAIMLDGGSVVSLEPGMQVVFRQAFPPGSHLSWDSRRKSWVVVQSDGVIKLSQNLTVWTTVEAIASDIGGTSELRLLPCDIGRWFGYRRSALSLGFTDDPKVGLTNTVPLVTPIRDMVEKK